MAGVRNLFAYSSDGRVLVIAQEREVLVYSGTDESPLWRCQCDTSIVAVGANSQYVLALEENGRVNFWDGLTGESHQNVNTNSPVLGMAVAPNGDCAVISTDCVSLVHNASVIQSVKLASITAVAWSANGSLLACAESNGRLAVYQRCNQPEPLATQPLARTYLKVPILSIASNPEGSWLATAGNAVWQLDPQRAYSNALMSNTQQPPQLVAISPDGRLLAFTMGQREIIAMHLNPTAFAGTITYADRTVTGMAFGPDSRLGIGLDTGDGNIVDFSKPQGAIARTDPHPGRPLNRWLLNVSNLPRPQAATDLPAGASPSLQKGAYPAWAGPLIGPVIGFLIGLKLSGEVQPNAVAVTIITATLIGFAGGGLMWLIDHLRKK